MQISEHALTNSSTLNELGFIRPRTYCGSTAVTAAVRAAFRR